MRTSIKKLALEAIMISMAEVKENLQTDASPEKVKVNAEAMKNLAEAFTLVKRGVMLPDYGREKKDEN